MANVMTNLTPTFFRAMQIVPRELAGALRAITANFADANGNQKASLGTTVKVPIVGALTIETYTPAQITTVGSSNTPTAVSVPLDYNEMATFHLTGEEELQLVNGNDYLTKHVQNSAEQAIRTVINRIEAYVCTAMSVGASRAVGAAGSTPFGTDLTVLNALSKILTDNGMPMIDRSLVINTAAGTNMRDRLTLAAATAGSVADEMTRNGWIARLGGFAISESAGVKTHTCGTGTAYQLNGALATVGTTSITSDTGAGTILAGDAVNFTTTDPGRKYIVKTALAANVTVLGKPGTMIALPDDEPFTIENPSGTFVSNFACHKAAAAVAIRAPEIPASPLIEQTMVTDAVTGLSLLFCRIVGDGLTTYRVHAMYGAAVVNPEGVAILIG